MEAAGSLWLPVTLAGEGRSVGPCRRGGGQEQQAGLLVPPEASCQLPLTGAGRGEASQEAKAPCAPVCSQRHPAPGSSASASSRPPSTLPLFPQRGFAASPRREALVWDEEGRAGEDLPHTHTHTQGVAVSEAGQSGIGGQRWHPWGQCWFSPGLKGWGSVACSLWST